MAGVLVFEHEPAEGDVVAGGVLHALEHAVFAEAHEHRGIELGVHAHGQVVGEQGQIGVLADVAEMTLDLARAAECVKRCGRDERVDAVALRALALVDDAQGLHVDDAGEHGHAMVHDGHGLLQHVVALGVGEEGDFARGSQEEQAVHACVDHAVDGALERLEVELLLFVQGDYHGGITPWNSLVSMPCLSFDGLVSNSKSIARR